MALTIVIILTFIFPAIVIGMIWFWSRTVKKKIAEKEKRDGELLTLLEKIVATKDAIIKNLKELMN